VRGIAAISSCLPKSAGPLSSSVRANAKVTGVSLSYVQRIWRSHGLQPHRIRTFKLSNDPQFAAKVRDIVGLYVDPPAHAVVLSVDEKSQIQAPPYRSEFVFTLLAFWSCISSSAWNAKLRLDALMLQLWPGPSAFGGELAAPCAT
jgi:hypothetical protein